ncbi:MAG: hypothetical protein IJW72_01345, partial [Alphaproteobacteria bacterium]|nr:hypothetical protein [Alphaproteobacteria bacterium]
GNKNIQGVGGGWNATEQDYGFTTGEGENQTGTLSVGGIAVGSIHAIISEGGGANQKDVLYRNNSKGTEYNTMETTLYLGDQDIEDVNNLITTTAQVVGATENALTVAGGASVGSLLSQGAANILGALNVDGAAEMKDTLKVGNALSVAAGGASIVGDSTITGNAAITGKATVNAGLDVTGELTANDASALKGAVTIGTDSTGSLQMLNVKGSANVSGSLTVGNDFQAPNISGINTLRGGRIGAAEANSYNFVADSSGVTIAQPNFRVGTGTGRLLVDSNASQMKSSDDSGSLYVGNNNATLVSGNSYVEMMEGEATLHGNMRATMDSDGGAKVYVDTAVTGIGDTITFKDDDNSSRMVLNNGSAKLSYGASGSDSAYVSMDSTGARIVMPNAAETKAPKVEVNSAGELVLDGVRALVDTDNFYLDKDKMILADNTADLVSTSTGVVGTKGIIFRRDGSIELPKGGSTNRTDLASTAGYQNVPGYIKLDRIIANQAYPDGGVGTGSSGESTTKKYDAYQLNPAYTSVMHDIKLTTRGGARLSDILPDFINRGIYVLDNTYPESKTNGNWESYTVSNNSGVLKVSPDLGDCMGNADCIASPWLGFVPAPQCPPGYSKVITINPIRWKMAEAYYITGVESVESDIATKFRNYFVPQTNPFNATFKLGEADGSAGMHTHQLSEGGALTFQTNTWLNTTVSANTGTFMGWHAIMGFLYYGDHYADYLSHVNSGGNYSGKVIWNLFPVYNEEMSAIANVYCYFERDNVTGWTWKNEYTGTYDQLTSFRSGYEKDANYKNRLNDPALGYTEAW